MIHHMMSLLTLALVTCLLGTGHVSGAWPVVTWHGAGGTASECDKMIETIRSSIPDVHILNVAVGDTPEMDHANTVIMQCNKQIDLVCSMIQEDPLMSEGFNAVGISQGGLLLRGLAERCPVPMRTLITFGSPH